MSNWDLTALTRRMPWSEVRAARPGLVRTAVTGVVILGSCLLYWAWLFAGDKPRFAEQLWWLEDALIIVGGILAAMLVVPALVGALLAGDPLFERRRYRVALFAAANGFAHREWGTPPRAVGQLFGRGTARITNQLTNDGAWNVRSLEGPLPVTVSLGNASFTSSKKSDLVGDVGYLHVALTSSSPNYVLDATANDRIGGRVGRGIRASQRLSLEGDFDRHFALYSPSGHERDALQLFTPDLMALLIDRGSAWDVEVVDDNLFVYSARTWKLHNAREMGRLLAFVDAVVPRLGGRVERIGFVPAAAPGGDRRLVGRVRTSVVPLLAITLSLAVLVGIVWLAS